MFACRTEIVVKRPAHEVFAFVADARNRPQWDDTVISEELTSAEPIAVGTTVRTRLRSMGREYTYTWVVTEHRQPTSMRIESTSGPVPTTLHFELAGEKNATRLTFTVTGRTSGPMWLLEPLLRRSTQRNLDRNFLQLKQLLDPGAEAIRPAH